MKVGEREFSGEGSSAQAARHDAAAKALQVLHSLPMDDTCPANTTICGGNFYYINICVTDVCFTIYKWN